MKRIYHAGILVLLVGIATLNIALIYYLQCSSEAVTPLSVNSCHTSASNLLCCPDAKPFTISAVIRDFEDFENDVVATSRNLSSEHVQVAVVADVQPYPALTLDDRVHLLLLNVPLHHSSRQHRVDCALGRSSYVLFVPDAVRYVGSSIQAVVDFLETSHRLDPSVELAAFAVGRHQNGGDVQKLMCLRLKVDYKRWTLNYSELNGETVCDAVDGNEFVLLLKTKTFLDFSMPFIRPLSSSVFIHSALRQLKVIIHTGNVLFVSAVTLFEGNAHNRFKHRQLEYRRLKQAYAELGIKLVNGPRGGQSWYGCNRNAPRCFGTVVNDVPDYQSAGRWTPPCCLHGLKTTAQHVFKVLSANNVRYWLEGGSLLGAARHNSIIPWDYDVDIGIYENDINRSEILSYCRNSQQPFMDDDGFVWEKAPEGEFYRVQYSQTNRLHVDIFPFYSRNGTMTKNTWIKGHRQDMEFPESFLQPLQRMVFAGVNASVPNHVRQFLELKFGPGVIENPKYPNNVDVK